MIMSTKEYEKQLEKYIVKNMEPFIERNIFVNKRDIAVTVCAWVVSNNDHNNDEMWSIMATTIIHGCEVGTGRTFTKNLEKVKCQCSPSDSYYALEVKAYRKTNQQQ